MLAVLGAVIGWRSDTDSRALIVLGLCWLVIPPALLTLLQVTTDSPGLVVRYWAFCLPALALLAAIGLRGISSKSWIAAGVCLAVIVALGAPRQLAIRTVNGHRGAQYAGLSQLLSVSSLESLPIWIGSSGRWRSLEAQQAGITARRAPLIIDPAPSGSMTPLIAGPDTPAFSKLVAQSPGIIAYPDILRQVGIPSANAFLTYLRLD